MSTLATVLIAAAAVGAALVGGVFYAFDAFIMAGLARLTPTRGREAMVSINAMAVRAPLMGALFGTAVLALLGGGLALGQAEGLDRVLIPAGCAAYLLGTVGVTVARNVPLNDALAGPEGRSLWTTYVRAWSRANAVRTASSLLCSGLILWALVG